MDADFLKRSVGEPLSEALASLVVTQPADPIEFIGEALLDYIKRREVEAKVCRGRVGERVGEGAAATPKDRSRMAVCCRPP